MATEINSNLFDQQCSWIWFYKLNKNVTIWRFGGKKKCMQYAWLVHILSFVSDTPNTKFPFQAVSAAMTTLNQYETKMQKQQWNKRRKNIYIIKWTYEEEKEKSAAIFSSWQLQFFFLAWMMILMEMFEAKAWIYSILFHGFLFES